MTLWRARRLFDFRWSKNRAVRKRQKTTMRRALALPVRWQLMRRTLLTDERLVVVWRNTGITSRYDPISCTLMLQNGDAEWSMDRAVAIATHELLHALDFLAFDTDDRDAIYALFHNGQGPSQHTSPATNWSWRVRGLFPSDHGHDWIDYQYREGVGEAFAEVGQRALLGGQGLPYEHDVDPGQLRALLVERGYLKA